MIMAKIRNKTQMKEKNKRWQTYPDLWEKLKPIAREMRHEPTEAENLLRQYLRRHQLHGLNFRREHSIGQFIVDFYCMKAKLVIEVDGPIHQYQKEEDETRQEFIESQKFHVLRFSNENVLNHIDEVIYRINSYLLNQNFCPLSASGERDRKRGR